MRYLWRAVDHEGEVLGSFITKTRDKAAALKFHEEADEAARLRQDHHHLWAALLPRSHERARQRGPAGSRPLGWQPGRERDGLRH